MAKKLRSVNARLQRALRIRKLVGPSWLLKYRPFVPTGLAGPSGDDIWNATAREALKLANKDQTIKTAFDTFGLDPDDPMHWRVLVEEMASIIFERKKAGRRKEWNSGRQLELVEAVDAVLRRNPKLKDRRACELLALSKNSPAYFQKAGTEGLVSQLRIARVETGRRSVRRSKRSK